MPELFLLANTISAHVLKFGAAEGTLNFPSHLKVQTTGPGAETCFESGPASNKQWVVRVSLEIVETTL